MIIQDHRLLTIPARLVDADIADMATTLAALWLTFLGASDKEAINSVLAKMEPDHIIAFATVLCNEMHANISIIHDGRPVDWKMVRTPLMTRDQSLGEALKLIEEYREG